MSDCPNGGGGGQGGGGKRQEQAKTPDDIALNIK